MACNLKSSLHYPFSVHESTSVSQVGPAGNPLLRAALTTGALAMAGDVLAQAFIRRRQHVRVC